MGTHKITTLWDWEAERIAEEIRWESIRRASGVVMDQEGRSLTVSGLNWKLKRRDVRAICDRIHVRHAWLDGVQVFR